MSPKSRLSREEKGKAVATTPSPTKDMVAHGSPLDEFNLIHHNALRDTENMILSQHLFVAESHRQICEEAAGPVEVGRSSNAINC